MESFHNSHEFVFVVLVALIPALVDEEIHPSGIVHEHTPGIRLLSNQQLDQEPDIGMTAQQFLHLELVQHIMGNEGKSCPSCACLPSVAVVKIFTMLMVRLQRSDPTEGEPRPANWRIFHPTV